MGKRIRRAAVLGFGVMGSGIAAHLANVGIPTLLLDIVPRELTKEEEAKGWTLEHKQVRNRLANQALERMKKQKPAPLMAQDNLALIETGNFEDDFHRLADVDWIIEVVVENLDVKRSVFARVDEVRTAGDDRQLEHIRHLDRCDGGGAFG
ncbi:Enoyl-CoA hydratase (isoleucine degradation) / 3-hydroxyacyl-CoA dehydrogenase [Geobacillus stearothermophilus]|uniref:Enoyl-CoA hydratase n=1 Tax=Geobacillus stearothermophilus TaxID=1422 RepID=A0A150NCT7_GEOSE|nr:Enoyl-CoA hydratase [Geobacillus stearothermophilus]OAO83372.1 Enoyl-CoA hydratase (isoleucine degradation) / 3-hydroxyacyl-CoA dehydrogenase [Geobacillus stearothermophilus]